MLQLAGPLKPWVDCAKDDVLSTIYSVHSIADPPFNTGSTTIHLQQIPALVRAYYDHCYDDEHIKK